MVEGCWSPNIYETNKPTTELLLMGASLFIIHPSTANSSISCLSPSISKQIQNQSTSLHLGCKPNSSPIWILSPYFHTCSFRPLPREQSDYKTILFMSLQQLFMELEMKSTLPTLTVLPLPELISHHFPSSCHSRLAYLWFQILSLMAFALAVTSSRNT